MPFDLPVLAGLPRQRTAFHVEVADDAAERAHRRLRREAFVAEQRLFSTDDHDDADDDPRRRVLVARAADGTVVGGVRLAPCTADDVGWWRGSRLVVAPGARTLGGVGSALVRAACAHAEELGALRFEATVQARNTVLFRRLGWQHVRDVVVQGTPHVLVRYPVDRPRRLAEATKAALAGVLDGLVQTPEGFRGDDGTPVPGTDVVAACDAILPSLVERDPEWAGWCAVLVNVNDLAAMGANPVGLLDALGAPTAGHARRVVAGLRAASRAWGIPVLGGHTQFGVPAALSVTALGRTPDPVPAGGGRPGHALSLTVDLDGSWRPGYSGSQWDSTSHRSPGDLRRMGSFVARTRPAAAKDVSMAGLLGTVGMLAEASGVGAEIDVTSVPRPPGTTVGDWFTCFPGFGMVTADLPRRTPAPAGPATTATVGRLHAASSPDDRGVSLRWPDGEVTRVIPGPVTGMGTA
ncbi:MSMEG_0567/sll0787 family protein [Kineococcus rhizosphaerae]|uniref:Putative N-acetyltransferase (TIGR04045 family) n=1 Tax=Kineococcus rhizosphaerae TaxID=559628 RepID=A0A2T0QWJ4_9ACTN|nr:MSMEG_0567/sll0787 family protein [Kineococcus rhizosphaerae]PRY09755.1 putative N-acetyltransferase (TIGR04045 family) [Kineococcus rhizosphaerae]